MHLYYPNTFLRVEWKTGLDFCSCELQLSEIDGAEKHNSPSNRAFGVLVCGGPEMWFMNVGPRPFQRSPRTCPEHRLQFIALRKWSPPLSSPTTPVPARRMSTSTHRRLLASRYSLLSVLLVSETLERGPTDSLILTIPKLNTSTVLKPLVSMTIRLDRSGTHRVASSVRLVYGSFGTL